MVYEVPPDEHAAFCERFVAQHRGDEVTVVEGGRIRASVEVLRDLALEVHEGGKRLVVRLGNGRDLRPIIACDVRRMVVEQHDARSPGLLRVECADSTFVLRFVEPIVPGVLDALP